MRRLKDNFKKYLKSNFPNIFCLLKFILNLFLICKSWISAKLYKVCVVLTYYAHPTRARKYTLNGKIPVLFRIYDNRLTATTIITKEIYLSVLDKIKNKTFSYYGDTYKYLTDALSQYSLQGKSVLICGLEACNCDMISIFYGATVVYVVDYQPVQHEHPRVFSYSAKDFGTLNIQVDAIFSISSFEHDGLGRYGDPLSPYGDIKAMENIKKYLKTDGVLFLAVPVGPDCTVINAHRIYGKIRLPMLLDGWQVLHSYGYSPAMLEGTAKNSGVAQPVFVLKKLSIVE